MPRIAIASGPSCPGNRRGNPRSHLPLPELPRSQLLGGSLPSNCSALQSTQVQPLAHRRILITRTRQQASELATRLELAPPSSFAALDAALADLPSFGWLLFTSANAVQAFQSRAQTGTEQRPPRIAAIGPATAKAVESIGLKVDLIPPAYVAESLLEALLPSARGCRFLLVRAEEARDLLPAALTAAGAHVTIAPAYRNLIPHDAIPALQRLFTSPATPPDTITFTSSSTARNLIALLEAANLQLPPGTTLASIGPITSATLRELGYTPTLEAVEPTISSLVEAIAAAQIR
jgi:uroporphyrinogen-III synthase